MQGQAQQPSPETAALQAALDAARGDAAAERARRLETEGRLRAETGNRFTAQEHAIDGQLASAESQATILQDRIETMLSEGNFKEAAATQRDLAANEARISQLKGQKDWIEQQKTQAAAAPADPVERFNSTERDWISRNPRYLSDPEFQAQVNAAAQHAQHVRRLPKDSPEYFRAIEADVYPERQQQTQQQPGAIEIDVDQGGGTDLDGSQGGDDLGSDHPLEQQHTMPSPIAMPTPDAPAMRIEERPEQPQPRAVGRGGEGLRATAAPPSRRIAEANRRNAGPNGRIEPTQQEVEIAMQLYNDIETNAEDRSPEAAVRWYHMMYHHPSHRITRRRHWVNGDGRAV